MNRKGFTLLELIIYLGLVGLVLTGLIGFFFNVLQGRIDVAIQQDVHLTGALLSLRITHEIRNASGITSASGSTLTLASADSSRNPTVFDLSGGQVRIGFGSSGSCPTSSPCPLSNAAVQVTALTFTNLTSGGSLQVGYSFTVKHPNLAGRPSAYEQTYSGSAEVRSH